MSGFDAGLNNTITLPQPPHNARTLPHLHRSRITVQILRPSHFAWNSLSALASVRPRKTLRTMTYELVCRACLLVDRVYREHGWRTWDQIYRLINITPMPPIIGQWLIWNSFINHDKVNLWIINENNRFVWVPEYKRYSFPVGLNCIRL